MNKNATALILIVLAIGIFFTFTRGKLAELKSIQAVNKDYQKAIDNSAELVKVRDSVLKSYNDISETDRDRLNKIVPDNVDNVRLIIDVKDDIAARHGLLLKNIKTASPDAATTQGTAQAGAAPDSAAGMSTGEKYGVVTLSFSVSTSYETFVNFLKDLEASLRIMDISRLSIAAGDKGTYDFSVDIKTYWLKQN